MSRHFQFTLKALLVALFGTGCLFVGMAIQQQLDRPVPVGHTRAEVHSHKSIQYVWMEIVRLRDGTEWQRFDPDWLLLDDGADKSVPGSAPHLHLRNGAP